MFTQYASTCAKRAATGYKSQLMPGKFDNIIVAMSSGVDSSVAASIFADQYPNTKGIYMQNWSSSQTVNDPKKEICYEKDWKDVCEVAKHLNIGVDFVNFESDYWIDVFEPMLETYRRGHTPNPDVGCNEFVKFGKLINHLDETYGQKNYWLITGHYARALVHQKSGNTHLLKGYQKEKDQSYYLSQINGNLLKHLQFPIGHFTKPEVRELAAKAQLPTAQKPDSQGICFVNNSQQGKFKNFLGHYLPETRGNVITIEDGVKKVWGKHSGLWSYTWGQKVGISMPQGDPKYNGTWFVSEKLPESNELVIVKGRNNPKLFHKSINISNFKILGMRNLEEFKNIVLDASKRSNLTFQHRSLQDPIVVESVNFKENCTESLEIILQEKQRAIAPGQYGCLYINERVLGSGTILNVW